MCKKCMCREQLDLGILSLFQAPFFSINSKSTRHSGSAKTTKIYQKEKEIKISNLTKLSIIAEE